MEIDEENKETNQSVVKATQVTEKNEVMIPSETENDQKTSDQ